MTRIVATLFVLCLCPLLATAGAISGRQQSPVMETAQGTVTGVREKASVHFRNIPYARPPVGALRWQPPQPPEIRTAPLDGSNFGPACPQKPLDLLPPGMETSEDCLTLNISVPAERRQDKPLPVLFWIHGGGFVFGTGGAAHLDSRLWNDNGVILVTLNYRLGALGFFAHPALSDRDRGVNFALMDMLAALRWVKENVAAAGGDPDRIVIAGLSAGGMAVQMLMSSADGGGLFQAAIAHSGYGTWPLPRTRTLHPLPGSPSAEALALEIGAYATGKPAASVSASDLYATAPAQLVDAVSGFYLPIADGVSLPDEPGIVFQRGGQHAVPYLAGSTSFEGSVLPYSGISVDEVMATLGSQRETLLTAYGVNAPQTDDIGLMRLFGDMRYTRAARYTAAHMETVGQPGYLFLFDHSPPAGATRPPGARHGADGQPLFNDDSTPVIQTMRHYWVNFIKRGNPNGQGLPHWPAVNEGGIRWLVFGNAVRVVDSVEGKMLDTLDQLYLEHTAADSPGTR